jgi:hypothetical protein
VRALGGILELTSGKASVAAEGDAEIVTRAPKHRGTTIIITLPQNIEISDQMFYTLIEGNK